MAELLFWLYLTNAILLISHEIDSAYWKEWNLFKLPGGINGFLLLHFPILLFVLYGLVLVYANIQYGLFFSLLLALSGIFAFTAHTFFMLKGNEEFTTPVSIFILLSTLVVSAVQLSFTLALLL
ncbi:hypothetical protein J2755_002241 [Methanohalophilus levihalophilus]|uniref:DUF6713 family protein n=1 Tax=Methanohalophilus levihalophilus TaxID=1431282 RepID=UPI001AE6B3CF|nr:DUF6713 family protein [Methanohalophilus levihalophilus]MBP2031278.1 hypothetical protein [Methanohalophilus levihalophilus]